MHRFLPSLLSWALLLSSSSAFTAPSHTKAYINHHSHSRSSINSSSSNTENTAADESAFEPLSGNRQKAWQHAKKALLRIGSKGATPTHGNSLRQLLDQHTIVKVKVNPSSFEDESLLSAFHVLKKLAVDSGASEGVELIHIRTSDKVILFGREGALEAIDGGSFPPPPPPPYVPKGKDRAEYRK